MIENMFTVNDLMLIRKLLGDEAGRLCDSLLADVADVADEKLLKKIDVIEDVQLRVRATLRHIKSRGIKSMETKIINDEREKFFLDHPV